LVACMRKLLSILNAVMRDRAPWRPTHVFPLDFQDGCFLHPFTTSVNMTTG
jgi:hypothetical protein